jgi:hypothetical protein
MLAASMYISVAIDPPYSQVCRSGRAVPGGADHCATTGCYGGTVPRWSFRPVCGLEFVEKFLTTNLTSTDTTERNAGMLRVDLIVVAVPPMAIAARSLPHGEARWTGATSRLG